MNDPDEEVRTAAQPRMREAMSGLRAPEFAGWAVGALRGAVDWLEAQPGVGQRIAVTGFCFGGTYSFALAAADPRVRAAVPFYGTAPAPEEIAKIQAPVLALYGSEDRALMDALPARAHGHGRCRRRLRGRRLPRRAARLLQRHRQPLQPRPRGRGLAARPRRSSTIASRAASRVREFRRWRNRMRRLGRFWCHGGMTDVLILGGTGWLSGTRRARLARAGRRSVTCLARGGRPAPDGRDARHGATATSRLRTTRSRPATGTRSSTSRRTPPTWHPPSPHWPIATAHWTYISTISVYADSDVPGADESAPLLEPAQPGDEYDYGRAKVAAEASVRSALGYRAAIVRPGLIVGPGDPTRSVRLLGRRASRSPAMNRCSRPNRRASASRSSTSTIVADFIVAVGRERWTGIANAVGGAMPLATVLAEARAVAGHTGAVVAAPDEWLAAHGVSHWAGPRSLPLWLPRELVGHWSRSNAAYRILGGRLRPLRETLDAHARRRALRGASTASAARGCPVPKSSALLAELS